MSVDALPSVFVVQHEREGADGYEDVKFIGVYSTRNLAQNAVKRLSEQPGFAEHLDGFYIEEYEVDKDHWTEGFGPG